MNRTEEKPYIVWDTCRIAEDHAKFLMEEEGFTEQEAYESASNNSCLYDDEWECECDALTELMKEKNPDGYWRAEVSNFGWRHQDGKMPEFFCDKGDDLFEKILPKTDCTFKVYDREDCIAINNAHHDSPCWAEWYYIYPVKQD